MPMAEEEMVISEQDPISDSDHDDGFGHDVVMDGAPLESQENAGSQLDQIMNFLLGVAQESLDKPTRNGIDLVDDFALASVNGEYSEVTGDVDLMLETWKGDPTYNSRYLDDEDREVDNFSWVAPGNLVWVKHGGYEYWPCIIKRVPDKQVNIYTRVTIMFVEPVYKHFLEYRRSGISLTVRSMLPFTPITGNRSPEEMRRGNESWCVCKHTTDDHTMFELAERMAIVYDKNKKKIVKNGQLDMELLGGLYWLAEVEWRKITSRPVMVPDPKPDIDQFKDDIHLLRDLSHWRESADDRQSPRRRGDLEEDESPEYYGYDYIQISSSIVRDSTDPEMHYSEESQKIVDERNAFAGQLLGKIQGPHCRNYLLLLRDLPANSNKHTWRTKAWKENKMWSLMHQNIRSPSGPIVDDMQVFDLYRAMRVLRREEDRNNVQFLRDCYDVWLPEALIYAIQYEKSLSYDEAQDLYQKGPQFVPEEIAKSWDTMPFLPMASVVVADK